MSSPSRHMYDTFKDEIWKELGPLDPDWFEALTAQINNEGTVSDQDDVCANQEGHFKPPFDKTAVDSQLFSTPKVFRNSRVASPATEDEQSFIAEPVLDKEALPWIATQSPSLFQMSKERIQGAKYRGLLQTSLKSPTSYAKHISESLGAQDHPDMSWTSSLNTPPTIASTVILTKPDESPHPASLSSDKNVVFVRKLFPSLSNASRVDPVSSKNNDPPTVHQGAASLEAGQNPESHNSPQSSLNQTDTVWRQKIPLTIEDGEIRSTIAGVLDGAEDVLSIFFTNSNSALRKVKTERIKRKHIIPTKEDGCSSTVISATNNAATSDHRPTDQQPGGLPSPLSEKTGDIGVTQWSPLSLSEIPPCSVDTSLCDNSPAAQVENKTLNKQLQSDFDSGKLVRTPMKITDSGFTKKKRKFVYTVETLKSQVQREDRLSQVTDSSRGIADSGQELNVKHLVKTPYEADGVRSNEMKKQGNVTEENLAPSVQAEVQDLDISQLSRDFAQDFSQIPELSKVSKASEDTSRNGFSPSTCLSAMKRAHQKARQANLHQDCDDITNRGCAPSSNQNNIINEGTVSDSGFQSAVADITHVTASSFVLPCTENNGLQWTGFKTDVHMHTPPPYTNQQNGKLNLDDVLPAAETDVKLSNVTKESPTSTRLLSSTKGTVDGVRCIPLNGHVHGSLPEKTVSLSSVHASGFKTASNKGIQISKANLEKAKRLFEETEGASSFSDQLIERARGNNAERSMTHKSTNDTTSNTSKRELFVDNSCQLTASQKADVSELCAFLEEADSQFEFTQFKTVKVKEHCQGGAHSPQKVDKELDPDFLMGIDFDDSFNTDAGKHPPLRDKMTVATDGKTNCETSNIASKSTGLIASSSMKREYSTIEGVSSSSKHMSESRRSSTSAETKNLDRAGNTEASKLENKDPLMLGVGFKTAGGNVRVSKKCLGKARALFADLEENLVTCQEATDKQSCEDKTEHEWTLDNTSSNGLHHKEDGGKIISSDGQLSGIRDEDSTQSQHQSGFQLASGKGISISAKAMWEANALFKDCDFMHTMSVKHKKSTEPLSGSVNAKKAFLKFENGHGMKRFFDEPIGEFEDVNAGPAICHTKVMQHNMEIGNVCFENTPALTSGASFCGSQFLTAKALSCTTSKNTGSSSVSELSHGGFSTASGARVFVSADAMKKAKCLFNDSNTLQDTNKQLKQKEDALSASHVDSQIQFPQPINGGFQTASGKGVTISSAALKKAKSLFSECDKIEDEVIVQQTKTADPNPPLSSRGFLAASGKPVAFSSEALQKAKALFSDIRFGAEIPSHVLPTRNSDKRQDSAENMEKVHYGFSTAGGAKVHVSQKNLLKAKNLFKDFHDGPISEKAMKEADVFLKDCDINKSKDGKSVMQCSSEKKNHPKFKQDQMVTDISEDTGGECTEFTVDQVVSGDNMLHSDDVRIHKEVTEDSNTASSLNGDSSLLPKPSPLCGTSLNIGCAAINAMSNSGGFCTASGKKVSVSDTAMAKAKILLNENATVEETHKQVKHSLGTLPPQTGGFQTANGKGVTISSAALKKAKSFFSECEGSGDNTAVKPMHSKMTVYGPSPREGGFLAASGKPVAFSSEALQKAKALFSDIGLGAEMPNVSHTRNMEHKDTQNDSEKIHCGFKTVEKECHDSSVLEVEVNQTSSCERSKVRETEESSVLCVQSFNLSGCSETQQKLLAQEALDCTKALLEDEYLTGQKFSMTLENVPLEDNPESTNKPVEEPKGTGKRLADDQDMTGQPPLKRRLLEEFNRTADGPRGSTLHPEKCCLNDIMKDRRVFKYSASLYPNITGPQRTGKNYMETRTQKTTPTQHSAPEDRRSAHSKKPTFIPPFLKNATTESLKNTVLKDNMRTPSTFVPPFKKQRTIVQDSSSKPQEEKEDKLFVTPSNSNTFVPPTRKTQSTADVTGNGSKEDIQTVALADTATDNLMNNEKLPAGCGSEDSSAEVSHVVDALSTSQDMFQDLHNIQLARDMQDMRIRKKKRQTIRPLPGSLFLTKTSGVLRIPLKAAVNGKCPARCAQTELYGHGVQKHVYEVTSETAESFRFTLKQFINPEAFIDRGGIQLADGGWLIPINDGTAGKEEFYRALCDTPGVDPKLISEEWVYNHYRWIVWKQASMERSFPETMGSRCLTPEQVLLQLKYRYDVEVDHSRRPALRKIMEKDDTAAKTLVLCVCGVVSRGQSPKRHSFSEIKTPGAGATDENPSAVVWLTDSWYAIKAQLDEPLTAMLHRGRLAVGGKLIIHGAQLVGSQDACSPLEAPESLMLKICANSSRPARWDAKLGFYRDPRPFLLPVSSLYSNGGPVGCVDIVILRSYPIQWMERKPDGGIVFRSGRAEEKEARRHNSIRQKAMEIVFAKIQAEFEKEEKGNNKAQHRRRTISRKDIVHLQDGEELYEAVGDDPAHLEAHLSDQQLAALRTYRCTLMEKKQAELQGRYRRAIENAEDHEGSCPKRDVTPVWRLCIADSRDQPGSVYQLNLWRPPSDLQSLLKEGCRYKVYNLTTSDGKKHGGNTTVQLSGTKKTQFQDLQASQEWLSTRFQPRVSAPFVDLQNPEFLPLCGEVDLTGFVISVIDAQGLSPAFYLADRNQNFVKVRCFSSLAQSGLEDVVKPRTLLALSNLQLRGQSTSPTAVVYAGDLTIFSTNPKEVHLQESVGQLRNLVQGKENFFLTAEEKLSHLVKADSLSSISSPALQARTPASTMDRRQEQRTNVTSQQPTRCRGSFTPVSRKPLSTICSTEKDHSSLKKRRALDYLSRIPSPPPLAHLGSVASPCLNKTFKPPRRSGIPSTLKPVQTPPPKLVSSPVDEEWVNDEELAMIDTQALHVGDLM